MKEYRVSIFSVTLNLLTLIFLLATFFLQYEYLFITRIVSIVFGIVYLVIELNKAFFSEKKLMFNILTVVIIVALIVSLIIDDSSANGLLKENAFLIPIYIFALLRMHYNELYDKSKS